MREEIMRSIWKKQHDPDSLARWDPTPFEIVRGMLELAKVGSQDVVCDLGSGDGRILFTAVDEFFVQRAIGYEIRKDLCENSQKEIQRRGLQKRISIIKGNFLYADISHASVITLYLFPSANEIIKPKLEKETRFGARIISHDYPIKSWKITEKRVCAGAELYLYIVPQAFLHNSSNHTENDGDF
jgi:hypothetical protein